MFRLVICLRPTMIHADPVPGTPLIPIVVVDSLSLSVCVCHEARSRGTLRMFRPSLRQGALGMGEGLHSLRVRAPRNINQNKIKNTA